MAYVVRNKQTNDVVIASNMEVVGKITEMSKHTVYNTFSALKADEFETVNFRVVKTVSLKNNAHTQDEYKEYIKRPKKRNLVKVG